jgi:hypothetical protein
MKHAHTHTHDGTKHAHWHEHDEAMSEAARDTEARRAHRESLHEHEHATRKVTLEITFDVGTLEEIGLGGFKAGWLDSERDGREYSLTAGAGVGSPYLEASVRGPGGQPSVYAQADIRTLVSSLWHQMETIQAGMTAAGAGLVPSDRSELPAAQDGER